MQEKIPGYMLLSRADSVVRPSNGVKHAVAEDIEYLGDFEGYIREIVDDMFIDHPQLFKMMGELIRGWDMEQAAACDFAEGYAIAYQLFSYEVEFSDIQSSFYSEEGIALLPHVEEEACTSFMNTIQISGEDGVDYRMKLQGTIEGRRLARAITEVMSEKRTDNINMHAVILGGLVLGSFLYGQLKEEDLQESVRQRALEVPATEAHDDIRNLINLISSRTG